MIEDMRFFINDGYEIDNNIQDILARISGIEGVVKPIVVLPDIHYKFSYNIPTGVVILAKDKIIPKFVNANCGLSFITTPFFKDEIDSRKTDTLFNYLRENISITTRLKPIINNDELKEIIMKGAVWVFEKYGLDNDDLLNFENKGSIFEDDRRPPEEILSFVPGVSQSVGLLSLGVLGYGNHFIELQMIDKVMNEQTARMFNISTGQLCFMVHSDSRAFGQSIYDSYSKRTKRLFGMQQAYKRLHYRILSAKELPLCVKAYFESINHNLNRMRSILYWRIDGLNRKKRIKFTAIDAESPEAQAYITSTYCGINYGYANRSYLAAVIRDGLEKVFQKKKPAVRILHDGNHDSLQKENIDGEEFYVHRNGATRALPPRYYPDHPIFQKTGQPVLLPNSLGRQSFLCSAAKGCPDSYYSCCHGVGRLIDRGQARQKFTSDDVYNELEAVNMKVYDYGRGYISEESPKAFKDVDKVLEVIEKHNIAQPVVRLKPLAALKGWR